MIQFVCEIYEQCSVLHCIQGLLYVQPVALMHVGRRGCG
jgi:hypothetical protein